MGTTKSKTITNADIGTEPERQPKQPDVFCTSITEKDELVPGKVAVYKSNPTISTAHLNNEKDTHAATANRTSRITTFTVTDSGNGTLSSPSKQPAPLVLNDQGKQTETYKKDRILKELKERDSTIKAMSSTAEKLCRVCRSSSMVPLVDGYDCSFCPEDFTRNLRFVEKFVITQNYELTRFQSERDSALNRLSVIAGDRLTNNNPNVTNLADKKRPTKLAEQYKDMYDNEWTDAVEKLEAKFDKPDKIPKKCIYHLFAVIKIVYRTCQRKSSQQLRMIAEHFFLLKSPSDEQIYGTWLDHPSERNRIIECRKDAADGIILNLQETLADDEMFLSEIVKCEPPLDQNLLEEVVATDYFRKCVEVCWRFAIQDPPLYLETDSLKGHSLDKDTYTEYTKAGEVISFVVWPALYLYQKDDKMTNGPLLAKGVVQPK